MTAPASSVAPLSADRIDTSASLLDDAARTARPIPQLTGAGMFSEDDAYAIQRAGIALRRLRGDARVGMKMGLTSRPKMEQMGVHAPIYGHLTQAMQLDDGGSIARGAHIHPRTEPEIAFVIGHDIAGPVQSHAAWRAVDACCAALEIIDSRYQDFKFTLPDVIADNGSSSRFVLGSLVRPRDLDVGNLGMVMSKNGVVAELGSSAAIFDHPLRSLVALINQLARVGDGLKAGEIVLAGGATAAIALAPGDVVELRVDQLGRVDFSVDAA